MKKIKIIQYATGSCGKAAIRAIADHPEFELVGCLVHNPEKAGKDAGELAGIEKLGVTATNELEDILSIDADAVSFMGLWPDLDLVCPMLESGKHVALSCGLIFPAFLGQEVVERLEASCHRGDTSVFGGGISPGYVETVAPIALTSLARRVDRITMEEFVDFHDIDESPELLRDMVGFGRTLEDVRANKSPHFDEMMPRFFHQTVALLADSVKLPIERFETDVEYIPSPGGGRIPALDIPPGTVGGILSTFSGYAQGEAKIVVKLYWAATDDLDDDRIRSMRMSNSTQWRVTLEGDPSMRLTFEQADSFLEAAAGDQRQTTEHSFVITAMNVLHSIPYLCEAKDPGIKHYGNLPLMAGRHTIR